MTDTTRRAIDLTHEAVDALTDALTLYHAKPDSNGDGGVPVFDALLAGFGAYLLAPDAVTGTLAGIEGDRKEAATLLLGATTEVRDLALVKLAQQANTRDVKVSLQGIAGGISATLDNML